LILERYCTVVKVLNTRQSISLRHKPILARETFFSAQVTSQTIVINIIAFSSACSVFLVPEESVLADWANEVEVKDQTLFVPFRSNLVLLGGDSTVIDLGSGFGACRVRPEPWLALSTGCILITELAGINDFCAVSAATCGNKISIAIWF